MIVIKFGGSSVRDAEQIRTALSIATDLLDRSPLLVASAMGDTTDVLLSIAERAEAGERESAFALLEQLRRAHVAAAAELSPKDTELTQALAGLLDELEALTQGIYLIRECSPRSSDAILSFGERLSTRIIAAAARALGIECELVDAREVIRTDESFGAATPLMESTCEHAQARFAPSVRRLYVTQGFIASAPSGVTTTLGRGGSDYTATILGSCLNAEEVQIWTDVDGIMTADPRVITQARSIPIVSYDEAAELAYFGAKVVHPATILPAVSRGIVVRVKNTLRPQHPGTQIQAEGPGSGLRAIAAKSGVTLITVESSKMLNAYGFLARLFAIFERHRVPVDLIATSEVSVSMTVDRHSGALIDELSAMGRVTLEDEMAIVCLVGHGVLTGAPLLARAVAALADTPVRMISLGSSDINLSFVVEEAQAAVAMQRLHEALFDT